MTIEINNNIINVSSEFGIVYFRLKQFEIEHKETKNKIIINNISFFLKFNLLYPFFQTSSFHIHYISL